MPVTKPGAVITSSKQIYRYVITCLSGSVHIPGILQSKEESCQQDADRYPCFQAQCGDREEGHPQQEVLKGGHTLMRRDQPVLHGTIKVQG